MNVPVVPVRMAVHVLTVMVIITVPVQRHMKASIAKQVTLVWCGIYIVRVILEVWTFTV